MLTADSGDAEIYGFRLNAPGPKRQTFKAWFQSFIPCRKKPPQELHSEIDTKGEGEREGEGEERGRRKGENCHPDGISPNPTAPTTQPITSLRAITGICSQHNILFDHLTVREH